MKYCPLMSFQKQYHEKEKCLGEDCAFAADAAGNCLVKQALQCYISKERTAAAEQETAERYWLMKKNGTRSSIVFNGESDSSHPDDYWSGLQEGP